MTSALIIIQLQCSSCKIQESLFIRVQDALSTLDDHRFFVPKDILELVRREVHHERESALSHRNGVHDNRSGAMGTNVTEAEEAVVALHTHVHTRMYTHIHAAHTHTEHLRDFSSDILHIPLSVKVECGIGESLCKRVLEFCCNRGRDMQFQSLRRQCHQNIWGL